MWNEYVWRLYMQSKGSEIVKGFEDNLTGIMSDDYPDMIHNFLLSYVANKSSIDFICDLMDEIVDRQDESFLSRDMQELTQEEANSSIDECFEELNKIIWSELSDDPEMDYKVLFDMCFTDNIAYYSTLYSVFVSDGLFVPYYFFSTYNVLEKIAETFDIDLPTIPKKSDYRGRVLHYAEICKALYKFRIERGLSFFELCAFLYDFAPKYVGGIDSYIIKELPEPKSAFFVGGGGANGDEISEDNENGIHWWQCSPDTRAGDLIVMYLRTPVSAISSIWRAVSVGFIDPFFWYYRATYIGRPIKIDKIPIGVIKSDEILSKMPIVSKNLQGINGVELRPSEYNHIVDLSGRDVAKLENVLEVGQEDYPNEKAVEDKLIKPLLKKLGYAAGDYTQQMRIDIGNHNTTLIPDFVLEPVKHGGHHSGFAVIEAKRSIKNSKELEIVKRQVRSYANQLKATYSVVASLEGIHVMSKKDDYDNDILELSWSDLSDADKFHELREVLGR